MGAVQVLIDQDILQLTLNEQARIFDETNKIVYVNSFATAMLGHSLILHSMSGIKKRKLSRPPDPQAEANDRLIETVHAAMFPKPKPEHEQRAADEELLGQTIRYRDVEDGIFKECTVVDFGKSYSRGEYYSVVYDDEAVVEISPYEMRSMLANREEEPPSQSQENTISNLLSHVSLS